MQVKLIVIKSVKFLVCLFLLDFFVGETQRYIFFHQKTGKFYRINYSMEKAEAKIFIFGSSHAASHYVPEVFEKEFGISCYNAGVLGQQILFHSALQSIVLKRTTPEMIILDLDPNTLFESKDQYDRLVELNPFYYRYPDIVGKVIEKRNPYVRLFLLSRLYQYNSTFVHVVRYWIAPQKDWKGYRPAYGELPKPVNMGNRKQDDAKGVEANTRKVDENMVESLEQFVLNAKTKNVKLVFVVSPSFEFNEVNSNKSFQKMQSIADQYHIPLINFMNNPEYMGQYSLFYDSGHLNDTGARQFSKLVADKIKNVDE